MRGPFRVIRGAVISCALTLLLAACGVRQATPEASPTEAASPIATVSLALTPTNAPLPTPEGGATPSTAASPTIPLPTRAPLDTPTAVTTPDPNAGVGEVVYQETFDGSSGWDWTKFSNEAAKFSLAGGELGAVMTRPDLGYRSTMGPDVKIGDQQLTVVARLHLCYAQDEYGVMFRFTLTAANNYNGYLFKLRCDGAARVELLRDEQFTVLVDWTPSPAIVPSAPAENQLMVWAAGDQFHFYVNERYLFSLKDSTYAAGFYGFYLRDRTSGGLTVSFDDLRAREVK